MKPVLFLLGSFLLTALPLSAQYNQWAWMAGDTINNQSANYGAKGIAAPANKPGARYEGGGEWVDKQGNFWHFGGMTNGMQRNDLWKFDPVTNLWTWMHGTNVTYTPGVYGTLGVAHAANMPGARGFASATWTDLQGRLWLFGGYGQNNTTSDGNLNDLWMFDPSTGMWTWMGGTTAHNAAGIYGTKGIPSAQNMPGGRCETDAAWTDAAGNLWLYGGQGLDANGAGGHLSDLWKYDPVNGTWTWVHGNNTVNLNPSWGTKGVAASGNSPGARQSYAAEPDQAGNLWLFAGNGYIDMLNDLWKYNINTNEWTWMTGSATVGDIPGVYGTQCIEDSANVPPSTYEERSRWSDDCGNLWVFGGIGYGGFRNHLWRYSVLSDKWTWVSGSSGYGQKGLYGTKGVSSPQNVPGARCGSLAFRRPNTNELWLFGGLAQGRLNDMWKFTPDKPAAAFTADTAGCPLNMRFTSNSTPGCNEIRAYVWDFGDINAPGTNNSQLKDPVHTYASAGTYNVKLTVINCTGSRDSITIPVTVTSSQSISLTSTPATCPGDSNGTAAAVISNGTGPYTYSWSTGGTQNAISNLKSAIYDLLVTDGNGCTMLLSVKVGSNPSPLANAGADTTITPGATAILNGSGGVSYSWSPATGLSCNNCQSPAAKSSVTTTYILTVTDNNGCTANDTVTVFVELPCSEEVFVPNAFSPNGDGKNDLLLVYNNCLRSLHFMLFDRWGTKVFETSDAFRGWDGRFEGRPMNSAVFVYSLSAVTNDGKEIKRTGNVSLLR